VSNEVVNGIKTSEQRGNESGLCEFVCLPVLSRGKAPTWSVGDLAVAAGRLKVQCSYLRPIVDALCSVSMTNTKLMTLDDIPEVKSADVRNDNLHTPISDHILDKFDVQLGYSCRARLKAHISYRLAEMSWLKSKCFREIASIKRASVRQLLKLAEVSGCLLVAIGFFLEHLSERQKCAFMQKCNRKWLTAEFPTSPLCDGCGDQRLCDKPKFASLAVLSSLPHAECHHVSGTQPMPEKAQPTNGAISKQHGCSFSGVVSVCNIGIESNLHDGGFGNEATLSTPFLGCDVKTEPLPREERGVSGGGNSITSNCCVDPQHVSKKSIREASCHDTRVTKKYRSSGDEPKIVQNGYYLSVDSKCTLVSNLSVAADCHRRDVIGPFLL